jgi:hypothetical protein
MPAFRVVVPFEPVIHETTDSRTFTQLPDSELAGGVQVHRTDTGYSAELTVDAARPGAAKVAGLATLERFLAVLAAWNYAFQIYIGGVRADPLERRGDVSVERTGAPTAISASASLFVEEHVEAVVQRANLDQENRLYSRYGELPEYVQSCLELNYLLVVSTRPSNRWLLAAVGLEALAVGTIGRQATLSDRLTPTERKQLKSDLFALLEPVNLDDLSERVWQRVLDTTTGRVADHVHAYLSCVGIGDISPDQINNWWRTRGSIAHGVSVDIERGDLNQMIVVFQTALRRTAGAERIT